MAGVGVDTGARSRYNKKQIGMRGSACGGRVYTLFSRRFLRDPKQHKEEINVIEIIHLSATGSDGAVLNDLGFKLRNGQIYSILDQQAADAGLLLELLSGSRFPSAGNVRINGFDMNDTTSAARRAVGYLPARLPFYENLTVFEYLLFVARAKGLPYETAIRHIKEALELMRLEERRDRLLSRLSEFERRRVGIAQAQIGENEILLLDAPTAGLPFAERAQVLKMLRTLCDFGRTVFFSTASKEEALSADEVLILHRGQLLAVLPTDTEEVAETLRQIAEDEKNAPVPANSTDVASKKAKKQRASRGEYEWIDDETEEKKP